VSGQLPDLDRAGDRWVLILIGGGIIVTVNFIIFVIWRAAINGLPLPDMAEVVFGAIIGGALVKIADVLSALVTLATGRQLEKQSDQLSAAAPAGTPLPVRVEQPTDEPVPVEER
jgi:hypothetical protein